MIGKLSGTIDSCFSDHAIIDVNGVGYKVYCATRILDKLVEGEFCQLLIETHVREDHIHLYGFLTLSEQSFFNLLQSVNGIGTRMALAILSNLSIQQIQVAIGQRDKDIFKSISGVGTKLAERIIIELKDKVLTAGGNVMHTKDQDQLSHTNIDSDAVKALSGLGVHKTEAQNLVQGIIEKNPTISINELIKLALKNRGSNV